MSDAYTLKAALRAGCISNVRTVITTPMNRFAPTQVRTRASQDAQRAGVPCWFWRCRLALSFCFSWIS